MQEVAKLPNKDRFRARHEELGNTSQRKEDMERIKKLMQDVNEKADAEGSHEGGTCSSILKMCRGLLLKLCRLCFDKDLRWLLEKTLAAGLGQENFKTLREEVAKCNHRGHHPVPQVPLDAGGSDDRWPVLHSLKGLGRKPWIEQCILLTILAETALYGGPENLKYILRSDATLTGADSSQRMCNRCLQEWQVLARTYSADLPHNVSVVLEMVLEKKIQTSSAILLCFCVQTANDSTRSLDWSKLKITEETLREAINVNTQDDQMMRHVDWIRSNVDEIDLSKNSLTIVPSVIYDFRSLISLDLSDNNLEQLSTSQGQDIFRIPHLIVLNLTSCKLSSLPCNKEVTNTLQELILKDNKLKALPSTIWSSYICHLDLSKNQFEEIPEDIGKMQHLVKLLLTDNKSLKKIPQSVFLLELALDLDDTEMWAYTGNRFQWIEWHRSQEMASTGYKRADAPVGAIVVIAQDVEDQQRMEKAIVEESYRQKLGPVVVLKESLVEHILRKGALLCGKHNKHVIVRADDDDGRDFEKAARAAIDANERNYQLPRYAETPKTPNIIPVVLTSGASMDKWWHDCAKRIVSAPRPSLPEVPHIFKNVCKMLISLSRDERGSPLPLFVAEEMFRGFLMEPDRPFYRDPTVKNEEYYDQLFDYLHKNSVAIRLRGVSDLYPCVVCTNLRHLCNVLNDLSLSSRNAMVPADSAGDADSGGDVRFHCMITELRKRAHAADSMVDPCPILLALMDKLCLGFVLPNQYLLLPLALVPFSAEFNTQWPDESQLVKWTYRIQQEFGDTVYARPHLQQLGHGLMATVLSQLPELWRLATTEEVRGRSKPAVTCWSNRLAVRTSADSIFTFGLQLEFIETGGCILLYASKNTQLVLCLLDDLLRQVWFQYKHLLDYFPSAPLELQTHNIDTSDLLRYMGVPDAEINQTDFSDYELLGKGSFGEVYKFTHDSTGRAAKLFMKSTLGELPLGEIRKELLILRSVQDFCFALKLQAVAFNSKTIVMELAREDTLEKHLKPNSLFDRNALQRVAMQMFAAIAYLHKKNILHLDISARNFFVMSSSATKLDIVNVKIGDFGTSSITNIDRRRDPDGTPAYRAPEDRYPSDRRIITPAKDVYCLGVALLEQLCGAPVVSFLYCHPREKPNLTRDQRYSDTAVMHKALLRQAAKNHCGLHAYILLAELSTADDSSCRPLAKDGLEFACSIEAQLLVSSVTAKETGNDDLLPSMAVVVDRSPTGYTPRGVMMLSKEPDSLERCLVRVPISNREKVSHRMLVHPVNKVPQQAWNYRNRPMIRNTHDNTQEASTNVPAAPIRPRRQGVILEFENNDVYTGAIHYDGIHIDESPIKGIDGKPLCFSQSQRGYVFFGLDTSKVVAYRVKEQGLEFFLAPEVSIRRDLCWKVVELLATHVGEDVDHIVLWLVKERSDKRELLVWDIEIMAEEPKQISRDEYKWSNEMADSGKHIKFALSNDPTERRVWVCSGMKAMAMSVLKNDGKPLGEIMLTNGGHSPEAHDPAVEITAAVCVHGVLYLGTTNGCIHLVQESNADNKPSHLCKLQAHHGQVRHLIETSRVLDIRDLVDSERRVMKRQDEHDHERLVVTSIGSGSGLLPAVGAASQPSDSGVPLQRRCQQRRKDRIAVDAESYQNCCGETLKDAASFVPPLDEEEGEDVGWQQLARDHFHSKDHPGQVIATWEALPAPMIEEKLKIRDWVLGRV